MNAVVPLVNEMFLVYHSVFIGTVVSSEPEKMTEAINELLIQKCLALGTEKVVGSGYFRQLNRYGLHNHKSACIFDVIHYCKIHRTMILSKQSKWKV